MLNYPQLIKIFAPEERELLMKKKILGLLLSLCIAASLFITAKADTVSATVTLAGKALTVSNYDSPV